MLDDIIAKLNSMGFNSFITTTELELDKFHIRLMFPNKYGISLYFLGGKSDLYDIAILNHKGQVAIEAPMINDYERDVCYGFLTLEESIGIITKVKNFGQNLMTPEEFYKGVLNR